MRAVLLAAIGLLYLASVPWYRGADDPVGRVVGLPDWVAVAIGCYAAIAVLNALAWLRTDVPDRPAPAGTGAPDDGAPAAGAAETGTGTGRRPAP